jgi:hypothetical protein
VTEKGFDNEETRDHLTRRQVLHGALAGGAMLSAGGLLANTPTVEAALNR